MNFASLLILLRALLECELGALRPSTLSCRCRRDLRAIALDAHNGWVGPVAADRRAPSHPGQHGHIALFTAKALLSSDEAASRVDLSKV